MKDTIGRIGSKVKIAAGLFWGDYGILGAQVEELTAAGVDWIHIEMRDGKYTAHGHKLRFSDNSPWLWYDSAHDYST